MREDFAVDLVKPEEIRQGKRELDRIARHRQLIENLEALRAAGVSFNYTGVAGFAVVKRGVQVFDFWAGTGKWRRRPSSGSELLPLAHGRGVESLIAAVLR